MALSRSDIPSLKGHRFCIKLSHVDIRYEERCLTIYSLRGKSPPFGIREKMPGGRGDSLQYLVFNVLK